MRMGDEHRSISLPPEMEDFVDSERISANLANYNEFQWTPDRHERKALQMIRENLLDIDLTHATRNDLQPLLHEGIKPSSELHDKPNLLKRTHKRDMSLGLHHYTFFHWGAFHPTGYGDTVIPVGAKDVLLAPQTIVTPNDIVFYDPSGMRIDAHQLPKTGKNGLNRYLDTIVTGSDWVDIIARRSLMLMQKEKQPDVLCIRSYRVMGEIKHYGSIAPSSLKDPVHTNYKEVRNQITKSMIEKNGIAIQYHTDEIAAAPKTREPGYRMSSRDNLPPEVGADFEKSRRIWRKILEVAQKS